MEVVTWYLHVPPASINYQRLCYFHLLYDIGVPTLFQLRQIDRVNHLTILPKFLYGSADQPKEAGSTRVHFLLSGAVCPAWSAAVQKDP